jgi:hypothetical protein
MELHPLDRLESALRRPGNLHDVVSQLEFEDLPTAAEFMGLRWIWWERHRSDILGLVEGLDNWPALRRFRALAGGYELLVNGAGVSLPTDGEPVGSAGLHQLPPSGSHQWEPGGSFVAFQERFHTALRQGGMKQHQYAAALTGAFVEMASNAVEHANSPAAPIASFEVTSRGWSFGVTDVGRGALASLRENPAYGDLEGEGEALEFMLKEGVTRTGEPGRGLGFSNVFKALVDRRVTLRFRSGGAVASWEGESPTDQVIHSQGLPISRQGFHVRVAGPIP